MSAHQLSRRQFLQQGGPAIASLGLVAGCGVMASPTPASPQTPRVPRVVFVRGANSEEIWFATKKSLAELGHRDGDNIVLDAVGGIGRPQQAVADLLQRPVDVIVARGSAAALAARTATNSVPILMQGVADPIGLGLVASLAHPGGNVTGLGKNATGLAKKRLELLREIVPTASQVAVFWNPDDADARWELSEIAATASQLGLLVHPLPVPSAASFWSAFQAAAHGERLPALVISDPVTLNNPIHVKMAIDNGLPTIYENHFLAANEGGLLAYGPSWIEQAQRTAYFVDRILRGDRPADLPIEQPTTFDLVVNLKTARALGLSIPQPVLAQATETIR